MTRYVRTLQAEDAEKLVEAFGERGTRVAAGRRCGTEDTTTTPSSSRVMLAYFSRPGENYYHGVRRTLDIGNTAALARMIGKLIDCDVYRFEPAEPYSVSDDVTVARLSPGGESGGR